MIKKILLVYSFIVIFCQVQSQTVTDFDGHIYKTVTIGTQVWMKENLKVTHFNNGDKILNITDTTAWFQHKQEAMCYYDNDSTVNATLYGALYNWFTVTDSRKLCPAGWHVPSDADWNTLSFYLDQTVDTLASGFIGQTVGGKLKDTGITLWVNPNAGATNSSGFSALPSGERTNKGKFTYKGQETSFWTSSEKDSTNARMRALNSFVAQIGRLENDKNSGLAVRCISDAKANKITSITEDLNIRIYPNPTSKIIYISNNYNMKLHFQLYTITGELVFEKHILDSESSIDIESLKKGIYIVKISDSKQAIEQKLVIE